MHLKNASSRSRQKHKLKMQGETVIKDHTTKADSRQYKLVNEASG